MQAPAVLLIVLLLCNGCGLGAAVPGATEREVALTVMSYNIAAGHGDLDAVAQVIRASGAGIVALQEVDVHWGARSGFEDQATRLAELLEMEVFFAPIYSLPAADGQQRRREFGLALLSRFPIQSARNHQLTRLSTQEEAAPASLPGFPEVVLDVAGTPVIVFNTHLDYRGDPAVRHTQVAEMLRLIEATSHPLLLVGDLNAEPHAAELAPLFRRLHDTHLPHEGAGFTFPADQPVRRIDYVLASPHFQVTGARVLDTRASDHRPVLVQLRLGTAN